jgi:ABC-type transporter Mla subunit MlaD
VTPELAAQAKAADARADALAADGPLWPFDEIVAYVNTARRTLRPALEEIDRLVDVVEDLEARLAMRDQEVARLTKAAGKGANDG